MPKPQSLTRVLSWFVYIYMLVSPMCFVMTFIVLGFITPGYDPVNYTISRLALGKYGYIQNLNFLQLALFFVLLGIYFPRISDNKKLKKIWRAIAKISSISFAMIMLFPSDPVENTAFSPAVITLHGWVHFLTVLFFFTIAPYGVDKLVKNMRHEVNFRHLSRFTGIIGYLVTILCLLWVGFYISNMYMEVRGAFQKFIALLAIFWLVRLTWSVKDKLKSAIFR